MRPSNSTWSGSVVFQCLGHTLALPPEQWRVLDQAHRKRNLAEYEGIVELDDALVSAVIRVAREFEQRIDELGPVARGQHGP